MIRRDGDKRLCCAAALALAGVICCVSACASQAEEPVIAERSSTEPGQAPKSGYPGSQTGDEGMKL